MIHTVRRTRLGAWLIPLSYSAAGLAAGSLSQRAANALLPDFVSSISVPVAISVYSAVASGMISLTAIVFALMFVIVQTSSSVYSPRLTFWISRDRLMSHALGVFTATFLYALTALVWVDRGGSGRVPLFGVIVVTALLVVSVGMFIGLTERIGLLQINRMLIFTGDRGRDAIDRVYPPIDTPAPALGPRATVRLPCIQTMEHHGRPQYVEGFDLAALTSLAAEASGVIEIQVAVGDPVLEGTPILIVRGDQPIDERRLRSAIDLDSQRAFDQDPQYALRLIVDIAIRALSPAINDPTTAVQALDQIGDLVLRLGQRHLEIGAFQDAAGDVRVLLPHPTWDQVLRLAFEEILWCGATSVQVVRRMNALVTELVAVLPEERRHAVSDWHDRIQATIERTFTGYEKRDAEQEDRQGLGGSRPPIISSSGAIAR
jgi:uncharacterized membrane protein